MRTVLILLMVITAPLILKGQGKFLGTADDTKRHAEQMVSLMAKVEFDKVSAIGGMIWHGTPEQFAELRQQLQEQFTAATVQYGGVIDNDYISVQKFGASLLRHVFLVRFERQPVRVKVVYYQSKKGWILLGITTDWNVLKMLDEDGIEQKTPPPLPIPMLPGMGIPADPR